MASSQEESFQLLQQEERNLRPFAMAIRLTPELLKDLKRVEAEGGACLMKFGVTPAGHVSFAINWRNQSILGLQELRQLGLGSLDDGGHVEINLL